MSIQTTPLEEGRAGIAYEAIGEIRNEQVEADDLPKFSDGNNVALHSEVSNLRWTESLGANLINVDGYLVDDWRSDGDEITLDGGKSFIADKITMDFVLPKDELIGAAKIRAAEDSTHFAYVLGGWAYQAKQADHLTESSKRRFEKVFIQVTRGDEHDTPDDATSEEYHGGRYE